MTEHQEEPQGTNLEKHVGVILQAVVVGLLAWSLNTTQNLNESVTVLKTQMTALQGLAREATSDRYRTSDADRDRARLDRDIQSLEVRVMRLEGKLR